MPKVLLLAWDKVFEIKNTFGNKQYKPEDIQELFRTLFNDVQNIHEELAEYINTPSWNRPAFYNNDEDDDEDYTITITLDFLITDSLSMRDEHLSTISETESDELIKSSVENLVPNPSESEDISDIESECDVPVCDDFTTFSNLLFDADDDFSSSDDESFSDEDEFSGELAHIDLISPEIDETDFDPEEEIHFVERLLYDNSSPSPPKGFHANPNTIIESLPTFPIPVEDSDPFMEEIDLFLASDGSIPPGIDSDYSDSEGDNLFPKRLLHDDPIPLPDNLDFSNVVRVFLPFFTYLVTSLILFSSGSEDPIFDLGISNYHFSSLEPGVSHRSERIPRKGQNQIKTEQKREAEIEFLLYQGEDSDFKDSIDQTDLANLNDLFVDPTPEMFTDEQPPDYSFPSRFDVYDDDFLEIESDADNFDDDSFDSKGEKIKEYDDLPSPDNEDKVFNPGILIHEKSVKIITRVAQEKKLAISYASLVFEDFDPPFYEPLVFKDVPNSMRLLLFSSENEEKIFKPGIYTSEK
nr:hypothetical protein [Tanacetum cinerariifolium]